MIYDYSYKRQKTNTEFEKKTQKHIRRMFNFGVVLFKKMSAPLVYTFMRMCVFEKHLSSDTSIYLCIMPY